MKKKTRLMLRMLITLLILSPIALFLLVNYQNEGLLSPAMCATIEAGALLMFMGAAILAAVWGKEAVGGAVLLLDGVGLFTAFLVGVPHLQLSLRDFLTPSHENFWLATPLVWPPLAAGALFLGAHWISRTRKAEHVRK